MPIYDERTALLIVDVQNDFADPHGSLCVAGGQEVPVVANEELRHALHDTWGAAFHPDLGVEGEVVRKGSDGRDGYSGFSVRDPQSGETYPTLLEHLLRERGVERLVICGLATDYCVVETTSDARMLGFAVEVLADGIRAVDLRDGDAERALRRMRDAGAEIV